MLRGSGVFMAIHNALFSEFSQQLDPDGFGAMLASRALHHLQFLARIERGMASYSVLDFEAHYG